MDAEFLFLLALGAGAGGFVVGLAGFGTSLFALGWWLQVMPPLQAVAVALVMGVAPGVQGVWIVRREINMRRLLLFLLPALLGIPIGLQVLDLIDARLLKIVVATFLLLYGGFFLLRRNLPAIRKHYPVVEGGLGFIGGILGAIAGLSGALPTMWLAMQDMTKGQSRALLQPYNTVVLGLSALMLALDGVYRGETLIATLLALPVTLLAAQTGIWTFKRLTDMQFRRLLIGLMFLSGTLLIIREIF
jgi:uncharacterized membrane protein YfcA